MISMIWAAPSCYSNIALFSQEMLGILLACFKCLETNKDMCIVNLFDRLTAGDEAVLDELDCPLLMRTCNLNFISPSAIHCPVSVVHACSDSCTFHRSSTCTAIELEAVDTNRIVLKHDWNNDVFCHNVYCMSN